MDSFEINKYFGATTGALMVFFAIAFGSEALFVDHGGGHEGEHTLAFSVPIESSGGGGAEPGHDTQAAAASAVGALMASADPAGGERVFKKCTACHNVNKGEANKIGPLLYGVVGSAVASVADFGYSPAMAAKGGDWSWEALDAFLKAPKEAVPGTKMSFAGLGDEDRADVMAFLNQHSDSPLPLPAVEASAGAVVAAAVVAPAGAAPAAAVAPAEAAAPAAAVAPAEAAAPAAPVDLSVLMASADPATGERVFRKCKACHNVGKGEANKIGPALYGVVGRDVAAAAGFSYSPAMVEKGGAWSWDRLNAFLSGPKDYVPGTKMTLSGLGDRDRANVMAYLNQNSDAPLPLP